MKKVLLIEDDKIVRENTSEILELANYKVKTAENGKVGVLLAKTFLPDIIICDILMPELDGYGVLQIVSKMPELDQIPFIFLTAKTHHQDLRKGMELGADDYINKPFEESELLRAVETRLKRVEAFESKVKGNNNISLLNTTKFQSSINIKDFDQFLNQKPIFKYKTGETIYCQGNQSNHIFFIKKGYVKTFKINELGKEFITGIYSDNEYFGYASFVKHQPHAEYSEAISNTQLYKINKDEVAAIINNNHHVLHQFIEFLIDKTVSYKDKMILLAYGSVRKKTAEVLLILHKEFPVNSKNEIAISRSNLADLIGIAKETLARTLHDFKAEKLINFTSKTIVILDKKSLQKVQ
ncbi:response regulator [Lutibacter sp.]|uniref:response regulator n=1 Tax=Lutibacter sp. TaxID=1925666 RepID=UPI001A28C51C|nr:response regulator [Lutibacter sp.]MBI9042320.1 response regulator [Lutibacter sp.]